VGNPWRIRDRQCEEELEAVIQYVKPVAIISRPRIARRNFDRNVRYPISTQNTPKNVRLTLKR
jgi:hypothetical protein